MANISFEVEDEVLKRAHATAETRETTVVKLLLELLEELAEYNGRRQTLREQIYR